MDAEVMVSTGDTYDDVSDFCLSWGGPHSTDSEKDHWDEEFVYIDFFEDTRENAALPDVPVDERIRNSIAMVLTDVDEQVLFDRGVTLKAALEWLERHGKQECSACSKISNNGEKMNEKDIEELKLWLYDHGYFVGNSEVAKSLREVADWIDD